MGEQYYGLSLTTNDWNLIIDSLSRTENLAKELKERLIKNILSQQEIMEEQKKNFNKEDQEQSKKETKEGKTKSEK